MKRKLKAFTLIELIIVMAIMTILMAAIMQLMKPIRATYVDSTLYEAQRATQNGIVKYINESLRYATNVGIYTPGSSYVEIDTQNRTTNTLSFPTGSDAEDAVIEFKKKTGVTDDKLIRVITIDNSTAFTYGNKQFYGRVLISRPVTTSTGIKTSTTIKNADTIGDNPGYSRLALGSAYYGLNSFSINVMPEGKVVNKNETLPAVAAKTKEDPANPGTYIVISPAKPAWSYDEWVFENEGAFITVTASSTAESAIDKTGNTVDKANKEIASNPKLTYVATDGCVELRNISKSSGTLDTRFIKKTGSNSTLKAAGSTTQGEKTYIVYSVSEY